MNKVKIHKTELRFRNKVQKNSIRAIAKKRGRSVNAEILQALDNHINAFKDGN